LFLAPSYWLDPKNGNDYFLVVQQPEATLRSFAGIGAVPLALPGGRGGQLRQVASLETRTGPQEVDQMSLRPLLDVEVDLAGRDLGAAVADIRSRLAKLALPAKTRVVVAGQAETLNQAETGFGAGLVLATVLLYLVIVGLFRSFVEPLVALLGAGFGLAGVLWGLWLGGSSLNVQSMLGMLMLLGLAAYHAILLIDTARKHFAEGVSAVEAATEAARIRLRPTLMALAATILGLLPSAMKSGMHAEPNTALAQALIGGLLAALAATFLLVPIAWASVARRPELYPDDESLGVMATVTVPSSAHTV
jgi:HAE1 family hydrophobic/amphiphilic exporter-1